MNFEYDNALLLVYKNVYALCGSIALTIEMTLMIALRSFGIALGTFERFHRNQPHNNSAKLIAMIS